MSSGDRLDDREGRHGLLPGLLERLAKTRIEQKVARHERIVLLLFLGLDPLGALHDDQAAHLQRGHFANAEWRSLHG
jgi:hypothetical protein